LAAAYPLLLAHSEAIQCGRRVEARSVYARAHERVEGTMFQGAPNLRTSLGAGPVICLVLLWLPVGFAAGEDRSPGKTSVEEVPFSVHYRLRGGDDSTPATAGYRPLDRQAILYGEAEVRLEVDASLVDRYELRRFSVVLGARPLCRADGANPVCVFDFGTNLGSWTINVDATLIDRTTGESDRHEISLSTLEGRLDEEGTRFVSSGNRGAMEERTGAERIPYDEISRVALVLGRNGRPTPNLSRGDFRLDALGVKGEQLVEMQPMSEVDDERLLFVLVEVSDYVVRAESEPAWRPEYFSFVRALTEGLREVGAPRRKLLLVRCAGGAEAAPVVDLDDAGVRDVEQWLLTAPPPDWSPERGGSTIALLQVYDMFLHDFAGQPLGVMISGGRDTFCGGASTLSSQRINELNPLWPEEKRANLLAELDSGVTDLFPHTEQPGFPLSWIYVPSAKELTTRRFEEASDYFYSYGGNVYRLASIRDRGDEGHTARDGTMHPGDVFREMFEELESSYRLMLRIPNPHQKRVSRPIDLRVRGHEVRTQSFYRPSASLSANIERYINSASKERRFRAAYAARDYPLDEEIYRKVVSWLNEEPSSQVRPVLEESRLIIEFKRGQASVRDVRVEAYETLLGIDAPEVNESNRTLLATLQEIAARRMRAEPERYGGARRVEAILANAK
jgi:hypothetical protein